MTVNQIYQIVNLANKQAWGEEAVQVTDLQGLIALGDTILSTASTTDAWLGALCDRIAKTIVSNKAYTPKTRGLKTDAFSFGAALQEVYVYPMDSSENAAWKIGPDNAPVPFDYGNHTSPRVQVKVYSNFDTWKYTVSIPDYQLKSAFLNAEALAAFISGIFIEFENSMKESLENMVIMCEANFIAEKLVAEANSSVGGIQAINVLAGYNSEVAQADQISTLADALKSPAFLKYLGRLIKDYIDVMGSRTSLFNSEGLVRFTPKDEIRCHMLSKLASAYATYLEADTFNKELVALPGYESIPYFQGIGSNTLADCSTIHVETASTSEEVEQSGILCLLFDPDAMGVMFDHLKGDSKYDPEHDLTKHWSKATQGFFNKLGHQGIVFYAAPEASDWVYQKKNGTVIYSVGVEGEAQSTEVFDVPVSTLQKNDIQVKNNAINGTLKKYQGWDSGPLAGEGYFLALQFTADDWSDYTDVKVGLQPSQGTGLVSIINDDDKNGVFKITNKDTQKLKIETTISGVKSIETFDLSGLTLA